MPIYTRSYRSYEGEVRRRFRWWVIAVHELRILSKNKAFLGLTALAGLHFLLRVQQVVAFDTLNTPGQTSPIVTLMRQIEMFNVDPGMFFDFIRLQAPAVFLVSILAGAGMICGDFNNNLMEVYFSKPLTWRDYVTGKAMALIIAGLCFTAVPAVFLVILHLLMSPTLETFREMYWIPVSATAFSLVLVLPCALGVLASSAVSRSERYASIAIFMIVFGDLMLGQLMQELMHQRQYALIAFPLAINRIGESLFQQRFQFIPLPWHYAAVYVGAVCLGALAIVCRVVRRAEVAA
ncbi:MAG TPA: ABC transporter permease subunit [Candidatus Hydrogenedentes bacterium]|nr:ABC transporter permease subunit [Candidatus Hydrogenedentota bacterium]HOV74840.1 ABC transporter permease subunit [Candidatus Hydrogenedentota bacterium]HPC15154.1 ABC transporter permease subunit [Candidatus Hydrogenedentota bacterium]HRT19591.1 ABC transporter permease subunit [Candidatus Hydrogenedentota bacterium]HRT64153.1 ABC transporter permease subunit [Candidatus Hydrogenedentota bacterium]